MESTTIRVRKNLLGSTEPQTRQKEIIDLLRDSYFTKINIHPIYQRSIRWTKDAMNDFIGTIFDNGLVPVIIMYQLSNEEKFGKNVCKEYEIVDGKHRVFTLKAFMDATLQKGCPRIKKPFVVYWNYAPNIPVFYKDTEDVQKWCRDNDKIPHFLTNDERQYFNSFTINITTIKSHINVQHRREVFMSLQKGIPVRNSDLFKNKTDCKMVVFINDSENNYEDLMRNVFLPICTIDGTNYWINWICRCFFLFKAFKETGVNDKPAIAFSTTDKIINKLITKNSIHVNPTVEELDEFDEAFMSFIKFIIIIEEGIKFNPTQIFALFYCFCDYDKINENIILSHMPFFSKEGATKNKRNICWETNTDINDRKKYFNECVQQIMSMKEELPAR